MHVVHPQLVAGITVHVRDERDNPLGTLQVVAATISTLTLGVGPHRIVLDPDALLVYDTNGLALVAGRLGPTILAALHASRQPGRP